MERKFPGTKRLYSIASDKVEGTAVYGADGDKIGRIENLMIDKFTGDVAYAVLTFGGFLGMGSDHYPLPWSMLKYDEKLGGYRVNIARGGEGAVPLEGSGEGAGPQHTVGLVSMPRPGP